MANRTVSSYNRRSLPSLGTLDIEQYDNDDDNKPVSAQQHSDTGLASIHARAVDSVPGPDSAACAHLQDLVGMRDATGQRSATQELNGRPNDEKAPALDYMSRQERLLRHPHAGETEDQELQGHLPELLANYREYERLLQSNMKHSREGPVKTGWDFCAGWLAFNFCFAPGMLAANAAKMPWLALAITPLTWSVTECLIPMVRATSWQNRHADRTYPLIMRLRQRRTRDWVRGCFGMDKKYYAAGSQPGEGLTASQYLHTLSTFKAWKGKVGTDDLPYFFYALCYGVRSTLLEILAKPGFLATGPGMAVSAASLYLAGSLAGAISMMTVQARRRAAYESKHPDSEASGETVTKTREVWAAQGLCIQQMLLMLDKEIRLCRNSKRLDNMERYRGYLRDALNKARSKSAFFPSIGLEMRSLFQRSQKLDADKAGGELSGRLTETLAGFLGKTSSLVPAVLFNLLVAMEFASEDKPPGVRLSTLWALHTILALGYCLHKEWEMPWRTVIGLIQGAADVTVQGANVLTESLVNSIESCCGDGDEDEYEQRNPADLNAEETSDSENEPGEDSTGMA